jgi:hypothetical protein
LSKGQFSKARSILKTAVTVDDFEKAGDALGVKVEIDYEGHLNPDGAEQMRSAMRAFADVKEKFPDLKIGKIRVNNDDFGTGEDDKMCYAETFPADPLNRVSGGTSHITLNKRWLLGGGFRGVGDLDSANQREVDVGFVFPNHKDGERSGYGLMMHEMGHVVAANVKRSDAGGYSPQDVATGYLIQHYKSTRGVFSLVKGDKDGDWDGYQKWLSANMSGYSLLNFDGTLLPQPDEALAEAFMDVEINGSKATETSKVLHRVLVDGYKGKALPMTMRRPMPDLTGDGPPPKPINFKFEGR